MWNHVRTLSFSDYTTLVSNLHRLRVEGSRSVRQFRAPRSIRLPVLLLGILAGVLAPAEGAAAQKRRHGTRTRRHPGGNRAGRWFVAAGSGGGRQRRGSRGQRRGHGRRRVLAVEALQMRQQAQSKGIPLVQALHGHQVAAHLGGALAPAYRVVIHGQLRAVVALWSCNCNLQLWLSCMLNQ